MILFKRTSMPVLASALASGEANEEAATDSEEAATDSEEAATDISKLYIYMLKCWKEGNAEELAKMVKTDDAGSEELKEFNEKLWISRDNNMAEKVRGYLADPEKGLILLWWVPDIWLVRAGL